MYLCILEYIFIFSQSKQKIWFFFKASKYNTLLKHCNQVVESDTRAVRRIYVTLCTCVFSYEYHRSLARDPNAYSEMLWFFFFKNSMHVFLGTQFTIFNDKRRSTRDRLPIFENSFWQFMSVIVAGFCIQSWYCDASWLDALQYTRCLEYGRTIYDDTTKPSHRRHTREKK